MSEFKLKVKNFKRFRVSALCENRRTCGLWIKVEKSSEMNEIIKANGSKNSYMKMTMSLLLTILQMYAHELIRHVYTEKQKEIKPVLTCFIECDRYAERLFTDSVTYTECQLLFTICC